MAGYKRMQPYTSYAQKPAKKQRLATRVTKTSTVLQPARYVKPSKYIELKYDYGTAAGTISNTGSVFSIVNIANGTGANQRIGLHVTLSDIEIHWHINQIFPYDFSQTARCYLVYDRQVNGASVTAAQIFETTTPTSPTNSLNRGRFSILWDSGIIETYFSDNANVGGTWSSPNAKGTKRVKINKKTEFSASGATQADIINGALYLVFLSSNLSCHGFTEANRIQFYD